MEESWKGEAFAECFTSTTRQRVSPARKTHLLALRACIAFQAMEWQRDHPSHVILLARAECGVRP